MKTNNKSFLLWFLTLSFVLVGCGAEASTNSSETQITETNTTTTVTTNSLPTTYKADAGRLLGSQCAQCHGTNGVSVTKWDSIAGEGDISDEIFGEAPIMDAQAHGYTIEEMMLIGDWLATLSKKTEKDEEKSKDSDSDSDEDEEDEEDEEDDEDEDDEEERD